MTGAILIQGAMDVELECLLANMEAPCETILGGYRFCEGMICGRPTVLSETGIGMVNAAAATVLGVTRFSPSVVINQGLAGGQTEALRVGDVVLGETAVNIHDFETPVRGRGEGSDPFSWSLGENPQVLTADSVWLAHLAASPYGDARLIVGRLGSGDIFTREADRILWLTAQRGHLCEDMESHAVYSVCARFGVPCIGVRIISNNELTGEPYQRTIVAKLQGYLLTALSASTMDVNGNGQM